MANKKHYIAPSIIKNHSKSLYDVLGKNVTFQTYVEIYKFNDTGKVQVQHSPLKSEEEQAKRIYKRRKYKK